MGAPKGHPKAGGRQKGTPNLITKQVKDMVIEALDRAGGVQYLQAQADSNPGAFLTLVGKILPLQVVGENEGPITLVIKRVTDAGN